MLALFDIEQWLRDGGIFLLAAIIFAESGLFFGFFLPGDSLLFIAGFLSSNAGGSVLPPLPVVIAITIVAAILGDQVGYWFGAKVGPSLFDKPESRLFKPVHVTKAHAFLDKYGNRTIVLARFVPIIRTFAPIVAGVGGMRYRTFMVYNVIGGVLWGTGVTSLGFFLGETEFVKNNIEVAIVPIVFISVLPVVFELWKHRREVAEEIEEIIEDIEHDLEHDG